MSRSLDGEFNIQSLVARLRANARCRRYRFFLVLAGEYSWCVECAREALVVLSGGRVLWVSPLTQTEFRSITPDKAATVLGQELDALVFDGHVGVDPDALGALTGPLRGGGGLVLLLPPFAHAGRSARGLITRAMQASVRDDSNLANDYFFQRFAALLRQSPDVVMLEEGHARTVLPDEVPCSDGQVSSTGVCRTDDQARAVEAIIKCATGHRRRPVVLTSDRGRGKSAALGIAAATLLESGVERILVTAPRRAAAAMVFLHAKQCLPAASESRGEVLLNGAVIKFCAPDDLCLNLPPADLVFVDEAAALPAAMLEALLRRYPRIVFATTVHGYEGTGRGFAVRFGRALDRCAPNWKSLHLTAPVRWARDDPLERFVFEALLLNAKPARDDRVRLAVTKHCVFQRVARGQLFADEQVLSEIFGLLVLAHYRTRPRDLRILLDGEDISVFTASFNGHIVGAILAVDEGGFDHATADAIFKGQRRPQGHLVPQTLISAIGVRRAADLKCLRVIRIAVHPAVQGRGIGSGLLKLVESDAGRRCLDCIGTSFGADADIVSFWYKSAYQPIRLGFTRDHASGSHALLMVKGLSSAGRNAALFAQRRFQEGFPSLLPDAFRALDPALTVVLCADENVKAPMKLSAEDWCELRAFAFAQRGYEQTLPVIERFARKVISDPHILSVLNVSQRDVLVHRTLQKRTWAEIVTIKDLSGKASAIRLMRESIGILIHALSDGPSP